MESKVNQGSTRGGDQPAITWRDVLRAVFVPPQDEPPAPFPAVALPRLWPVEQAEPALFPTPPVDPNAPPGIRYEDSPVEVVPEPGAARIGAIGIGTAVSILLVYFAQTVTARQTPGIGAGFLYLMAALLWLGLLMFEVAPPDGGLLRRGPITTGGGAARPLPAAGERASFLRAVLGSVALALSTATYVYTAGNVFTLIGVTAWLLSIALWMIVAAERGPDRLVTDWIARLTSLKGRAPTAPKPHLIPLAAFVLILGMALFFRSFRLDSIPNEMTSDHVEKLLDANDVAHGIFHVFFTRNAGREAFQFYILPIVAAIFGTGMSFLTLKIATVIEGVVLIPLVIRLGREVVDWETGLLAAGLLAISWWHTLLARLGLRIALTPLVFTLVLIALVRAIRTGSRRSWLWAGVWMGIGVYCYQALRLTPLVAIAAFAVSATPPLARALIAQWKGRADAPLAQRVAENVVARQGLNLLAAGLIALAIFVPMLRVWHDFPADLWNRVINRTTNHEVAIEGSPVSVLVDNYVKALGMFNARGDASWFAAVPGAPVLDLITGSLFFLGVAGWLVRLRARHDPVDAFLLVAGLIMLLPSALSIAFPIENPSTTRASATIPVVFLIAAWPVALIRQRWTAVIGRTVGLALSCLLVGVLIGGATVFNYQTYFLRYADSYRHSALNPSEVAVAVRDIIGPDAPLDGVWLQGWPFWHDYRAIGIEAGDITFDNAIVDVPALTSYLSDLPGEFAIRPLVFILHPQDQEALRVLREHFPNGEPVYRQSQTEGRDFILFVMR